MALSDKALKDREGRENTRRILRLFSEHGRLSTREIRDLLDVDSYDRVYDRVRYLHKKGVIGRLSRGRYTLAKRSAVRSP